MMLRVGMIGAGIISKAHADALARNPRATLAAVVDLDADRASEVAAPFGAAVYTDYRHMLADGAADAVIINLPHFLHVSCAVDCAAAGLHLLVEKPMANTTEECDAMMQAADAAGVVLQIAHVQRYFPQNRAAQRLIDAGEIGDLLMVHDLRTSNYFLPQRPRWFLQRTQSGGGILMNFGAHSLDKIIYLTGSPLAQVTGHAGYGNQAVDVDGNAQLFTRTQSGISATVTLCGYAVEPINETMLYGTRGSLRLRTADALFLTRGEGQGFLPVDTSGFEPPFDAQLADFMQAIASGTPPPTDGRYGRAIIDAIETVYKQG